MTTVTRNIQRSLTRVCGNMNKVREVKERVNQESQCEEKSLITIPSLKVLITRKILNEQVRSTSSPVYKTCFTQPTTVDTFINVRSVIRKPLLVRRATEHSNVITPSKSIKTLSKQGKLIRGSTLSCKRNRKSINCI